MSVPPGQQPPPVYTDPATGRPYTVDPATGQSRWLDQAPPPATGQPYAPMGYPQPVAAARQPRHTLRNVLLAVGGVFVLLIVIAAINGGGKKDNTAAGATGAALTTAAGKASQPANTPNTPASAKPTAAAGAATGMTDKDWTLVSLGAVADDGIGQFGAEHARIRNGGTSSRSATFTVTLSKSGAVVATLHGIVNDVAAGRTVTVGFLSTDKYVKGPYQVEFQVDATF